MKILLSPNTKGEVAEQPAVLLPVLIFFGRNFFYFQ